MPYSLLGGCLQKAKIDGQDFSVFYLSVLEQQDNLASLIKFNKIKSVFEIGGGFGANIHILLENYKNIKKVIYLDIPPNLYIGTQYLKAFYGSAVFDYRALRSRDSIKFSENDDLEIFCIAPWQIEKFNSKIDLFINSHSFVEMPEYIVKNYVNNIQRLPGSEASAIALTTYSCFDLNTTFHPDKLPKFFKKRKFIHFKKDSFPTSSFMKNIFFISPGKFSY
jgi:putative sugar O-methyltransferase